jgi:hypothetical protein
MIGADAKPPLGQQLALVMSGDVTEIEKIIFFFICIHPDCLWPLQKQM